jgi:hypothetical protein
MQGHLRQELLTQRRRSVPEHARLVDFYHAKRTASQRESIQQSWMAGNVLILAATVAFGMGIDKPDVRWVFHHSMPKSLEGAASCSVDRAFCSPVALFTIAGCPIKAVICLICTCNHRAHVRGFQVYCQSRVQPRPGQVTDSDTLAIGSITFLTFRFA